MKLWSHQSTSQSFSISVSHTQCLLTAWSCNAFTHCSSTHLPMSGTSEVDGHTHTHTHTYRDTHINYMQSLNCPPLLFIPHFTSSLSFFQHLWGPQSAAGMMDSRLISKENHPSPLTSQNSRREASMPFRKNK